MKLNIKRILKKLTKANFTSLVFALVSVISVTFAWFAYSNVLDNGVQLSVRSWKIDINEGESLITNKIEIDLDEFYPGMETVYKKFSISNGGDISSIVSYKINSLRIYDEEFDVGDQNLLFDNLAQTYPFSINFNLNKSFLGVGDEVEFSYSISWPLDSGDDIQDGLWGNRAYEFAVDEQSKKNQNALYQIRDSISLDVELVVEQFVSDGTNDFDNRYSYGTKKHLKISDLSLCSEDDITFCNDYYVIEKGNLKTSTTVKMFPVPDHIYYAYKSYEASPDAIDSTTFLDIISTDVENTKIVIPGLSNRIMGYANNKDYYSSILQRLKDTDGHIEFSRNKFPMLQAGGCYWVKDDNYPGLAVSYLDRNTLQLGYYSYNSCYEVSIVNYNK